MPRDRDKKSENSLNKLASVLFGTKTTIMARVIILTALRSSKKGVRHARAGLRLYPPLMTKPLSDDSHFPTLPLFIFTYDSPPQDEQKPFQNPSLFLSPLQLHFIVLSSQVGFLSLIYLRTGEEKKTPSILSFRIRFCSPPPDFRRFQLFLRMHMFAVSVQKKQISCFV